MKKLLPIVLLVLGLGAGGVAGWFLQPHPVSGAPAPAEGHGATAGDGAHDGAVTTGHYAPAPENTETIRMPNQFVVPLIDEGRVRAMVVIGLALELEAGHTYTLAQNEPRLRAIFLQLLFDHANLGGFEGMFTSGEALLGLRRTLREAARAEVGPQLHDVLITELLRQES